MFTQCAFVCYDGFPWSVGGAAVGYGAGSGVCGKDLLTKAYPQGTLRRQDAARGVDGGPDHAAAPQSDHG